MAASSDSFALSKNSCCGSVTSTTLSNSGLHSSSSGRLTTGTGYFNGFTSGHPGRLGKISLHKGLLLEYTQCTVQATWGETVRLFAYGALSVVLVIYLRGLGLTDRETGTLLTLTLGGDTLISLWL